MQQWPIDTAEMTGSTSPALASVPQRVIGYLIDAIILAIGVSALLRLLDAAGFGQGMLAVVGTGAAYAYFILLEARDGQTLGKRVMKTRVVDESGQPLSMGQSIIRNILRIIDTFLFGLIGLAMIIVTKQRQRIGDLAARTLVVRE